MSPYEREHWDHEAGVASEHQNAYSWSCMNRKPDDKAKIKELVAAGRFVVIAWSVEYCSSTDAPLPGRSEKVVESFATYEEAVKSLEAIYGDGDVECDGEFGYDILPHKPAPPTTYKDDEIPF